jgi:hypothetical protein
VPDGAVCVTRAVAEGRRPWWERLEVDWKSFLSLLVERG